MVRAQTLQWLVPVSAHITLAVSLAVASAVIGAAPALAGDSDGRGGARSADATSAEVAGELGDAEVIEVDAPPRQQDEPAFATVVHTDDRRAETATLAEVVAESAGVQVRSLGGLGGFSSVSIRGTAAGNTTVLVDGVPLSRIASVTADLGRFELASFSRIEVYRGGAPLSFGSATAGGAINLVTRTDPGPRGYRLSATAGAGSFGARHARLHAVGELGGGGLAVIGSYRAAAGDFSYLSDNGTALNPDDDRELERQNNGFEQVDLVARYRLPDALTLGSRLSVKNQGIPGFGTAQTEDAALGSITELIDGGWRGVVGSALASASAFAMLERARFTDRRGEVGLGAQDRRYLTAAAGASFTAAGAVMPRHWLEAGVDVRADGFDERELGASSAPTPATRGWRIGLGLSASDSIELGPDVLLRPAVRVDVLRTDPALDTNGVTSQMAEPRTDLFPSPRLAARWMLAPGVALKSNAGLYFRAPTLLELFGDRGFVVGNPALEAERGVSGDVGVTATGVPLPATLEPHLDRVNASAVAFATRADQAIAFSSNAGGFTGAVNLDGAVTAGTELSVSARAFELLSLTLNHTLLWTRRSSPMMSIDGNEIPQRPRHQLYGRAELAHRLLDRRVAIFGDVVLSSQSYLDAANRDPVPRRLLLGAGASVELLPGLALAVSGKNLLDEQVEDIELSPAPRPELTRVRRAIADFFGYPLPGRALYATLELTL